MKKLMIGVALCAALAGGIAYADQGGVDSSAALKSFSTDLQDIRSKLQNGSMSATQAQVLLAAIQARQNQVLIAQNQEIIDLLKAKEVTWSKMISS